MGKIEGLKTYTNSNPKQLSDPYKWDGEGQQKLYTKVNEVMEVSASGTFSKYKIVTGVIFHYNNKNEIIRTDRYQDGIIIPSQFVFGR